MIYMDMSILAKGDDGGFSQIIFFVIIAAMGLIGNITKAAKAKKQSGHTGNNRPERTPSGQRLNAQKSRPEPHLDEKQRAPKYYEPGGFAEAILDETLEKTLKIRAKRAARPYEKSIPQEQIVKPMEGTEVMAHDLESMGHLETLDPMELYEQDADVAFCGLLSLDNPEDLARAVLYAEIIGKPVGLRDM